MENNTTAPEVQTNVEEKVKDIPFGIHFEGDKAELAKALTKFQESNKKIAKNGKNPHFGNEYATLDDIIDGTRENLAKAGLSFSQIPVDDHKLVTILFHTSGANMMSAIQVKPTKADPQGQGSAITYAKRYALSAILGIATGDDDDGNAASEKAPAGTAKVNTKKNAPARQGKFEQAKGMVEAATTIEALDKLNEKFQAGTLLTDKEKENLAALIDTSKKRIEKAAAKDEGEKDGE